MSTLERAKEGDAVEVHAVWASQGATAPPLRSWRGGYTFVRQEGTIVVVKLTGGTFAGVEVRYPAIDVRPAQAKTP